MQAISILSTLQNLYLHQDYTAALDITSLWSACIQGSGRAWWCMWKKLIGLMGWYLAWLRQIHGLLHCRPLMILDLAIAWLISWLVSTGTPDGSWLRLLCRLIVNVNLGVDSSIHCSFERLPRWFVGERSYNFNKAPVISNGMIHFMA